MSTVNLLIVFGLSVLLSSIIVVVCTDDFFEEVNCTLHASKIEMIRSNTKCIPRDTLISIDHMRNNYNELLIPTKVPVKRCDGGRCTNNKSCFKKDSRNITLYVTKFDERNVRRCYAIEVEEHTTCQCACNVMPHHCSNVQQYSAKGCMCECKNMEEKKRCETMNNMKWNAKFCKCECVKEETECSTGSMWVPKYCKCLKDI